MSCSVGPDYSQAEADADGIVLGHAYTLLSVAQILDDDENQINLVKLRNPWGSGEWKGDWSDKSDKWTDDIRQQLNYFDNRDDGVFWMDFEDFRRIFRYWSVNKYVDGHQFSHVVMKSNIKTQAQFLERYKNPTFYLTKITVSKPGLHTFGVS